MSANDAAPAAPRGWYPHPEMAGTERYWNGTVWTGEARPWAPPPTMPPIYGHAPVEPPPPASKSLIWASYGLAVVSCLMLPLIALLGVVLMAVGIVFACVLASRYRSRHGVGVLMVVLLGVLVVSSLAT